MLCRNRELPLFCLGSTPPSYTTSRGGRRCIGRRATTSSWTASGCHPPHPRRVRRNVWTTTGLRAPRRQRSSTRLFLQSLLPRWRRCTHAATFGKQATQIGAWWPGTFRFMCMINFVCSWGCITFGAQVTSVLFLCFTSTDLIFVLLLPWFAVVCAFLTCSFEWRSVKPMKHRAFCYLIPRLRWQQQERLGRACLIQIGALQPLHFCGVFLVWYS
jgi:hypothetical protein